VTGVEALQKSENTGMEGCLLTGMKEAAGWIMP
jgi:hypothetical protein